MYNSLNVGSSNIKVVHQDQKRYNLVLGRRCPLYGRFWVAFITHFSLNHTNKVGAKDSSHTGCNRND